MNDMLLPVVTILLIIGLIYYIMRRSSNNRSLAITRTTSAATSNVSHENILNIIQRDFPTEQHTEALDAINECKNSGEFRDTIQLIILQEAKGNINKVREYVEIADKVPDYRDLALALINLKSK